MYNNSKPNSPPAFTSPQNQGKHNPHQKRFDNNPGPANGHAYNPPAQQFHPPPSPPSKNAIGGGHQQYRKVTSPTPTFSSPLTPPLNPLDMTQNSNVPSLLGTSTGAVSPYGRTTSPNPRALGRTPSPQPFNNALSSNFGANLGGSAKDPLGGGGPRDPLGGGGDGFGQPLLPGNNTATIC